jgi:hypothetical protein
LKNEQRTQLLCQTGTWSIAVTSNTTAKPATRRTGVLLGILALVVIGIVGGCQHHVDKHPETAEMPTLTPSLNGRDDLGEEPYHSEGVNDPCLMNPTLPECSDPNDSEVDDPCQADPSLPTCSNNSYDIRIPGPCAIDPNLLFCRGGDPCDIDPNIPFCGGNDPCDYDPTLTECGNYRCACNPQIPGCDRSPCVPAIFIYTPVDPCDVDRVSQRAATTRVRLIPTSQKEDTMNWDSRRANAFK